MDLIEVKKLAIDMMTAHGVGALAFEYARGKRQVGACHFRTINTPTGEKRVPFKITISRHYAALITVDEVRQTMLHEIAHAKAGEAAGHGPEWQRMARELGYHGKRTVNMSAKPEGNVKAYCPGCDAVLNVSLHRLPLRVKICSKCKTRLKWFKNGTLVPLHEMPARYQAEIRRHIDSRSK